MQSKDARRREARAAHAQDNDLSAYAEREPAPGGLVENAPPLALPLFPSFGPGADVVPAMIRVTRVSDPPGYLGEVPVDADPEDLRAQFGGGTFRLELRAGSGQIIRGGSRTLTIDAPVKSHADGKTAHAAASDSRGALELQTQLFREQLTMLKTEADATRERAKLELELTLRRQQAEAEERENRERQRFEREMARERERADRERAERDVQMQREREREAQTRQADLERHEKFLLAMQSLQKEQSSVLIAALQNQQRQTDPLDAVERLLPILDRGGMDPATVQAQQLWGTVQRGLELAAGAPRTAPSKPLGTAATVAKTPAIARDTLIPTATNTLPNQTRSNRGEDTVPNPAPTATPTRDIKANLMALIQKLKTIGLDPSEVLARLNAGELSIVPTDWIAEAEEAIAELDQREDAADLAVDDPKPEEAAEPGAPFTGPSTRGDFKGETHENSSPTFSPLPIQRDVANQPAPG